MRWFHWCLLGAATLASAAERPLIFPEPQKMPVGSGSFTVDEQVPILVPENAGAGDLALARQLIADLSDRCGMPLRMAAVRALPRGRYILMGSASNPLVREYLAKNHATLAISPKPTSCAPGRTPQWWRARTTPAPSMAFNRCGNWS